MLPLIESPIRRDLVPIAGLATELPAPDGFSFATLIGALRRRKGLILAVIIVINTMVFGLIEVLPARYTATVALEIKQANTRTLVSKPVANGLPEWMPGDNVEMVTQVNILRSRALAAQAVKTLGLSDDPEFQSGRHPSDQGGVGAGATLGAPVLGRSDSVASRH